MDISKRIKVEQQGASGCPVLPEEIVQDILSRLPAKSLCRFRCVSRSFDAVISSHAFQDAHYQRNSGGRRLFIRPAGVREPLYAWHPGGGPAETIMSTRRLPQGSILPVSKSCRGLILLKNTHRYAHHVWNPSTGEILTLPDRIPLRARWSWQFVPYGLCYCSDTRRHKVVRIYDAYTSSGGEYYGGATPTATVCEVFTLNESAYWRPAAAHNRPHAIPGKTGGKAASSATATSTSSATTVESPSSTSKMRLLAR
ncbi:putative F-box protein At3g52320 [Panicum virgatum]|uniref:putative F-box protein At3g52320 n=1 Tax=Panicum virgatum TaxID=38727 RepID=UPI0019D6A7C6|nr:putative F-box protein At3g52320 [Panicum virgatum]